MTKRIAIYHAQAQISNVNPVDVAFLIHGNVMETPTAKIPQMKIPLFAVS